MLLTCVLAVGLLVRRQRKKKHRRTLLRVSHGTELGKEKVREAQRKGRKALGTEGVRKGSKRERRNECTKTNAKYLN